jgi:hypothetical protein
MPSYHGNPNLKSLGYQHIYTKEELAEYKKCSEDMEYFIETYCKIISLDHGLILFSLYDFQRDILAMFDSNRKSILLMGRQQGKSILSAAYILWYTLFNEGKTAAIIANKGAAAREVLNRYQIMYENLPIWIQQGVKSWNKGDVELENGSKVFAAATTASAIRGKSINILLIDECAIIQNNIAEDFFASVYPTISSGITTKIILTSTAFGMNHFWKFFNEATPEDGIDGHAGRNGFVRMYVPYWKHPDRTEEWAEAQRKTLGELKFNQEILCEFIGSSNTLINGQTLRNMSSMIPIRSLMNLDVYEEPVPGRFYFLAGDCAYGVSGDYSAFVVVDATEIPYKLVAKYRCNTIMPMLFPSIIRKVALEYNMAYVLIENNDLGKSVLDILHQDLEYENLITTLVENGKTMISPGFAATTQLGVKSNKVVKKIGCFTMKSLLEENKFPIFDADLINELSTFTEQNGTFKADEGKYDDLAISLMLFCWASSNPYFNELTNISVREKIYREQMEQIEEQLTPFLVDDGREQEQQTDGSYVWVPVQTEESHQYSY